MSNSADTPALTDDQIDDLWHEAKNGANVTASTRRRFARAILAAIAPQEAQAECENCKQLARGRKDAQHHEGKCK